jgi:hypothetical protein
MRQMSELGVLLEEQHRQVPDERRKKPQAPRKNVPVKGLTPPPAQPAAPNRSATADSTEPATVETPPAPAVVPEPPPAFSTSPIPSAATPEASADPPPTAAPSAALPASVIPAPVGATGTVGAAQHTISPRSKAAPWVAASAAALAIGGAALWWDGDRTASDLDARFASGDLSAADNGSYGRARRESIAGRAMVAGAVVLGAVAVALWW